MTFLNNNQSLTKSSRVSALNIEEKKWHFREISLPLDIVAVIKMQYYTQKHPESAVFVNKTGLEKHFYILKLAFSDNTFLEKIMKVTRFEPWSYVDLLHRDLRRSEASQEAARWVPAIDIVEEKSQFTLRADLPGVSPEDVEITMDAGVLTLSGARTAEKHDDDTHLRRNERVSGPFFRQFNLPDSSDADNIKAKHSNGILEVVIPKLPEIAARRISVEAA